MCTLWACTRGLVPRGRTPHRRVLYGRAHSRSPTLQTVVLWSICRDLSCKIRVFVLVAGWSLWRAANVQKRREGLDQKIEKNDPVGITTKICTMSLDGVEPSIS